MADPTAINQGAIKGLLFDKDGTLFDYQTTWGSWAEGFIDKLSKGDVCLAQQIADVLEFDRLSGKFRLESQFIAGTSEQVLGLILAVVPGISRAELDQFYYESTAQAELAPPVSLTPLLNQFAHNGIKVGVATNDHEATAREHLRKAGIAEQFDFIAGFDSGFGAKPEPGMQHGFCAATGLQPGEVVMVGDSLHDIEAGQRAGMMTIGVLTGMVDREELETQASVVLNHIGEIPDWLQL